MPPYQKCVRLNPEDLAQIQTFLAWAKNNPTHAPFVSKLSESEVMRIAMRRGFEVLFAEYQISEKSQP